MVLTLRQGSGTVDSTTTNTTELENQIDQKVYELYGLTEDFVVHILTPIHDLQRINSPQYLYLLKIKKDHLHSNFFAQRIEATPQAFWSEAEEWSALTRNCGKPGFYRR